MISIGAIEAVFVNEALSNLNRRANGLNKSGARNHAKTIDFY